MDSQIEIRVIGGIAVVWRTRKGGRVAGWDLTGGVASAEFGGGEAKRSELSVSQAMEIAAGALDAIPQLNVLGEVTGFRGPNARSGHCYFQIKDDSAAKRTFDLRDGMQVSFKGSFNLYKPTGRMSFVARSFSLAGEGLLRQQVAQLAEKLRREGLMDDARKRHIPVFCSRVAVVTSLSGAVIDDVKRTLRRRNPLVEIVCVGAKVQGEGAPEELIEGLHRAAAITPAPDCILLVRGGGSFEDLMTFNDEALARAVAASPIPVVTGIGHEPDTSICDMVSDRRASTPTAAAESVAPAMSELVDVLETRRQRLGASMASMLNTAAGELDTLGARGRRAWDAYTDRLGDALDAASKRPCLSNPTFMVDRREAELAQTADRLSGAIARSVAAFEERFARLPERLCASTSGLDGKRHELTLATSRLEHQGRTMLAPPQASLGRAAASLDALSPLKVLGRGYAIAYGETGVATSVQAFKPGDAIRVRMADGSVAATVDSVD